MHTKLLILTSCIIQKKDIRHSSASRTVITVFSDDSLMTEYVHNIPTGRRLYVILQSNKKEIPRSYRTDRIRVQTDE